MHTVIWTSTDGGWYRIGYYSPESGKDAGKWMPLYQTQSADRAARMVSFLNGGAAIVPVVGEGEAVIGTGG